MSGASEQVPVSGLPIDLRGKRAFIAGIADDNGYGWAIAKSLAAAGAEIPCWYMGACTRSTFSRPVCAVGNLTNHELPDGSLMEIAKVYPLDAVFDSPEDVPEDVKTNKRYAGSSKWTVSIVPRH
ncbi:hypothetical protein KY285_005874 [Solanum tuberosum]|nr:hypothetical protein KY285_005874 [Solanum tuberosum]